MPQRKKETPHKQKPLSLADAITEMEKDSEEIHNEVVELDDMVTKLIEDFDESNKTIHELAGHRETLVKIELKLQELRNLTESHNGDLSACDAESDYDDDAIANLERVKEKASLYVDSRNRGKFEEAIDFDELWRAVEDRP